jgi:protein-S-isoprenylcysteine O-methyltransferase Ste14
MNESQNNNEYDESFADSSAPALDDSPTSNINESNISEQKTIMSRIEDLFRSAMLTNILLAGLFSISIYLFYHDYEVSHRFSSLLMMLQLCCITLFLLIRTVPARVSTKPLDWTAAIIATSLPVLISPVSSTDEIILLMLLQLFGIFISIVAVISLSTSFAIVPALRKIKTGGLYSIVRHPLYFSYFLTFTCVVLQNFSLLNVIVLCALYASNIYRIKAEEELLSLDPGYAQYKMQVRWRLIPFVW